MSPRSVVPLVALIFALGCAGGGADPAQPGLPDEVDEGQSLRSVVSHTNRNLWGIWGVRIHPYLGSVEVVPMRGAEMHLNAVRLLEVTPCADCLKISNVAVYPDNELTADLTLKHPYPDLLKLTAFDVRGIFISGADYTFPVSERSIAWGEGLPRVLNADGYTALFNPTEFPETIPPAFGYIEGKYAPGGDLSATLNPFLAYAEDSARRMFWPGSAETRKVRVRFPDGPLEFGYAVDACWHPVEDVVDPVEDFPPEANCLEAYRIDVAIGAGLGPYVGSSVPVEVTVYDHQGLDTISLVTVEAPDILASDTALDFSTVAGEESYLFSGTLTNELGAAEGDYPLLARVIDTEEDPNLGGIDAWQVSTVSVGHKKGWARTWGGKYCDTALGIAGDSSGNVYVIGQFSETVDFDPGPGVDEHTSNGGYDAFVSKFDSSGNFQWARTWGGADGCPDCGYGVALDDLGNVYVTGYFWDTVDFDPGPGIDEHSSNGDMDAFLSKFDSNGNFQWARTWGGASYEYGMGVATDGSGNVYVTGYFEDTVDFDPGPEIDEHSSNGGIDVFLSKFDSSGEFQWALTWGGPAWYSHDEGLGVAVNGLGDVHVTGKFEGIVDFDPGPEIDEHTSNGWADVFLSKFDSSGTFHWARTWGGGGHDQGRGVAADGSGNAYVTGDFSGTVDFDPGPGTDEHSSKGGEGTFLSKFDSSGNFQWARTWGGIGIDQAWGLRVAADGSGGVYVTGYFWATVDFNPGPGVDEHTSNGVEDIFLSKFDSSGNFQWARTWGGMSDDMGFGVAVDNSSTIFVAGHFKGTADFDPGPGVDNHSSNGSTDVFLSKFPPDGNW